MDIPLRCARCNAPATIIKNGNSLCMSHLANQQREEHAYEAFRSAVYNRDWNTVNQIFLDLQDEGLSHLEPNFVNTLNEEELAEYKRWHYENSDRS